MENEEIEPGKLYVIDVQWTFRKYKQYIRSFNSQNHFDNWFDFIAGRNGKIIGISKKEEHENK